MDNRTHFSGVLFIAAILLGTIPAQVCFGASPQLSGMTVVTAPSGSAVAPFTDGYTYDLQRNLSVRVNPVSGESSVAFKLDGTQIRIENIKPYAAGGNDYGGVYYTWKPPLGKHILVATPYSDNNGKGTAGASIAVHFTVVDDASTAVPRLAGMRVITAPAGLWVAPLDDGYIYNLQKNLSIRAHPLSGVGSVVFKLDGTQIRVENDGPFAVAGNSNDVTYYQAWKPPVGKHTLVATPYSHNDGTGTAGESIAVHFTVVNGTTTPTPTPTPTATPTPRPSATPSPTPRPSATPTPSPSVTLAWNASTSTNVAGYHLSYGTASRTYTHRIDVGKDTRASVEGLSSGRTYYFVVSAYNSAAAESSLSNEVSFTASSSDSSSSITPDTTPAPTAAPQSNLTGGSGSSLAAFKAMGASPAAAQQTIVPPSGSDSGANYSSQPAPDANSPALISLSARIHVGANNDLALIGFTVKGSGEKAVVVRAIGPSLSRLGIMGALSDPFLAIRDAAGHVIASNNNWRDSQQALFMPGGRYHALQPRSDLESAVAVNLPPGAYTMVVNGKNEQEGVALAEIYDLSQNATSKLSNISACSRVGVDENVLVGSVSVAGSSSANLALRALAPSLVKDGTGQALPNPVMRLYDKNGTLVRASDTLGFDNSEARQLPNAGHTEADSREPVMIAPLTAGTYTVVVEGSRGAPGVASFEASILN